MEDLVGCIEGWGPRDSRDLRLLFLGKPALLAVEGPHNQSSSDNLNIMIPCPGSWTSRQDFGPVWRGLFPQFGVAAYSKDSRSVSLK